MPDEVRGTIAASLKRSRLAAALTQEELAERSGVSARTVSDIERGLRTTVYADTARRLADALRLTAEDRQRFESLLRGRERPSAPPTGQLPTVPTPLVGRASELRAITSALSASDARLLTLTGPGGIGKSRLAIEAGARLRASFPGGIVFVQLGDLDNPALVLPAMAKALGVVETGERLELLLERQLATQRVLLLLDTFEHVVDAAGSIAALMTRGVEARFLVTSRRPLHIRGELEFPVPPLDLPRAGTTDLDAGLERWPATALFMDRALAVNPGLRITDEDARLVLEICRKLNGLPLAIELCAARVKHLPLRALAEQLDHRLQVLTGGPSDLPVRQRTMRETVGWSHDLLGPVTRKLFRRLAASAGGFDLEFVEAVCGPNDEVADPLDGVSTLVDHSLVTLADAEGAPRYGMLDVIAEFAAERLAEAGEAAQIARRHALHFLAVAEEAEPNLVRATQREAVRRLDIERANLRRAVAWTIENNETTLALRFTVALWRYWRHTGELAEGRRWCEATLAVPGPAPDGLRAKALWGTAFLAYPQGDYQRMAELAVEDLAVAKRGGDAMDLRNALTIVGQVALCDGRYADALGPLREALSICQALGATWHLGTSHLNLGNALLHSGATADAERTYREGLRVYRELGDQTFVARMGLALAHTALVRGDPDEAERLARQSLIGFETSREPLGIAEALDVLAAVAGSRGDIDRAARLDGAARAIQDTIASRPAPFERSITGARIEAARSSADVERWRRAWDDGRSLDVDEAIRHGLDASNASEPG
jgi:predicted ATPase/transcriptional regulator with XRE-family HTH domain